MSLASYVKTIWSDRVVQFPRRYRDELNNQKTFTPDEGTITNAGTSVTATRMNNLETGVEAVTSEVITHLADNVYQTAGGTTTAITLTIGETLINGLPINFMATSSNSGSATTINGKPFYKPNTTTAPNLIAGKPYTAIYNLAGDCFFIKASAEGDAVAGDVLASKKFSNDNDTGLSGTLDLSNLTANNIRKGVTINGVTGSSLKYGVGDKAMVSAQAVAADTASYNYYAARSYVFFPAPYNYDTSGVFFSNNGSMNRASTMKSGAIGIVISSYSPGTSVDVQEERHVGYSANGRLVLGGSISNPTIVFKFSTGATMECLYVNPNLGNIVGCKICANDNFIAVTATKNLFRGLLNADGSAPTVSWQATIPFTGTPLGVIENPLTSDLWVITTSGIEIVDPTTRAIKETITLATNFTTLKNVRYFNSCIYIIGNDKLAKVHATTKVQLLNMTISNITNVTVDGFDNIYAANGATKNIPIYSSSGSLIENISDFTVGTYTLGAIDNVAISNLVSDAPTNIVSTICRLSDSNMISRCVHKNFINVVN